MRRYYTPVDMFRYVKFLQDNPHLKNNINTIKEYDKKYPKLTKEQQLENIMNFNFKEE